MIYQLLVAFMVAWYLFVKWKKRHLTRVAAQLKSSIPRLPLIGHVYVVFGNAETAMKGLQRMFRDAIECGGTVAHWYFDKLYITVADPVVADIILKNCLEKDYLMKFFHEVVGDGSIFASVKKWRSRRKMIVPTFSMKNLTRFVEVFATQSSILAEKLENLVGQDPSPMWKLVSSYAMDTICAVADPVVADIILKNCLEKDYLMKFFHEVVGDGSIFASVKKWRSRRKMIVPTFSMKNLTRFVEVFATQSSILAEKLENLVGQDPSPMWKLVSSYAMDTICETTLGIETKAQENDHPGKAAVDNIFHIVAKRIVTPWLHSDIIFKRTSLHRILTKNKALADNYIDETIKSKRQNLAKIKNPGNDRFKPFVDLVLESASEESEKVIREECMVLLGAGIDTSAVSVGYALVMLAAHPEVQEKAYRELMEILHDPSRPVQTDDLHRLKYLDAVVRETLRLYTPVPVIVRKIKKDIELPSGVIVPAGCGAVISIWGIHHNPAIWGKDVEEFRPERFLDSTPRHPAAFIPFSYGPRNCVGYQYAKMSLKTVLCTVLRKFRLVPASEQPLRLAFEIMMRDVDQYRVGIEMRQ